MISHLYSLLIYKTFYLLFDLLSDAYLFPEVAVGVIRYSDTVIEPHPEFCEKIPCKRVTVGQRE